MRTRIVMRRTTPMDGVLWDAKYPLLCVLLVLPFSER